MEDAQWRPLFSRDSAEPSEFDVLHEGVPEWLDGSLWRWLMDRAAEGQTEMIARLERRMHHAFSAPSERGVGVIQPAPNELLDRFWRLSDRVPERRLTLLDAVLADLRTRAQHAAEDDDAEQVERIIASAERLEEILAEGGSAWRAHVDQPSWGLVRRVDETLQRLVESVSSPDTDAARMIGAAWQACYRHDPDPDAAYRQAVLAVEAVTIPVTIPDSPRAILGGVSGHIRDTMEQWSVAGLDAKEVASGQVLYDMVRMLWHNQQRHALPDGTIADVTQPEAEAAVSLAITLVHWFTSGLAKKLIP